MDKPSHEAMASIFTVHIMTGEIYSTVLARNLFKRSANTQTGKMGDAGGTLDDFVIETVGQLFVVGERERKKAGDGGVLCATLYLP